LDLSNPLTPTLSPEGRDKGEGFVGVRFIEPAGEDKICRT